MQKITSAEELRAAIAVLEADQRQDGTSLKEEFYTAYEQIQPLNIIKKTVKEVFRSNELKEDLLDAAIGLAAGYVSKALFEGKTHSPARKLVGTALMLGVTNVVAKHPEAIKAVGMSFIELFYKVDPTEGAADKNTTVSAEYEE